jgi:hypothetical protein
VHFCHNFIVVYMSSWCVIVMSPFFSSLGFVVEGTPVACQWRNRSEKGVI